MPPIRKRTKSAEEELYLKDYRRRLRSVTQEFKLLDIIYKDDTICCKILGNRHKTYDINISICKIESPILEISQIETSQIHSELHSHSESELHETYETYENYETYETYEYETSYQIDVYCSCPDFTIRNNICKHMYWLGAKKIGILNPTYWEYNHLQSFINNNLYVYQMFPKGRNETCPICLEKLDYADEYTVCCNIGCHNSVHLSCWDKYYYISYSDSCVVCRTKMPGLITY